MIAQVGASAALTGLIFVSVSINLTKIIGLTLLPSRALTSLLMLLTVLVVSSLMLVPGQPLRLIGTEVLVLAVVVWYLIVRLERVSWRDAAPEHRRHVRRMIIVDQVALVPYFVAGILTLAAKERGLYWLVPAILLSFVKALMDAWVLLVEINR